MTCKDCIYSDVCINPCGFHDFKDRSRFVELPYKPGERVFIIVKGNIDVCRVESIVFNRRYIKPGITVTSERDGTAYGFVNYEGKGIYLTQEEAERALKERDNNA